MRIASWGPIVRARRATCVFIGKDTIDEHAARCLFEDRVVYESYDQVQVESNHHKIDNLNSRFAAPHTRLF
ncbi:unnamed protein product [Fusarium fujikuroi]|uniref:Uncharacterized protein n=1 Tax=Fusarium fujikuroi TaxID=5127 RepID=A0A9Q9U400_FUSFU|nr:unnamed protein product [Fusarium fujikuroi]VTT77415.1 unnamed protein product [Fusarium fujikuroi]VZI03864.1 unnamed protein product [Fusarium fujikuroi]